MKLSASFASLSLAALLLLGASACAHADLIKAGTTYHRDFLAYDASGNNLTASAVSTFTVQQSVAGAAPVTITPTITYKGAGHFDLVYTPALDAAPGSSALIITAPGATQVDINDQVIGFDPASDLGAAALAQANTGITTANTGITQANTGISGLGTTVAGVPAAVLSRPLGHGMTVGQLLVLLQASNGPGAVTNSWNTATHTLTTSYQFSGDSAPVRSDNTVYPSTQITAPPVLSRTSALGTLIQP